MDIIIGVDVESVNEGIHDERVVISIIVISDNVIIEVSTNSIIGIDNEISITIRKGEGSITVIVKMIIGSADASIVDSIIESGGVITKVIAHFYRLCCMVVRNPINIQPR